MTYICLYTLSHPMCLRFRSIIFTLFAAIAMHHGQAQTFHNLDISSEDGLEILTWNIEWFPKNNSTPKTIHLIS